MISALSHCAGCGELPELGVKLQARRLLLPRFEAAYKRAAKIALGDRQVDHSGEQQ